ncbi:MULTISPECIES: menaquinone biosynthetic enzyme MqnA/MqnD family protein [Carboxydocella]|uniref:Chorismate dehydratase n=2 Tax=Carboxydocella TaxID=178898 RepID=A0A1T4PW74_9FIRM|nr:MULTISPECIES: menaquinone biosynthesis protein [Carboxydocella]AVX20461.1 futalosine synthase [Carboxydocella thermautotrophica]AVX30882.1 futalosine synthase [Carboxydocella thermautotrophica]SJZ95719.1 futalosine synthase [Carboxydocella sporoproducens DSM 16521]GAW29722.1 hypothetical protein ULO1_22920 [Carboxydocella sp. ULO1]GAW31581.1 hypothetical protein JDF658_13460 [Carboxydocella sp. JDF658]
MASLRLGQVDFINCLPVYTAINQEIITLEAEIVPGPPAQLNRMFLQGELDVTPISSIEYARHADQCLVLPDLSIGADGEVMSLLLFSRIPVTELDHKVIALPNTSATTIALLKILLEHYYHISCDFVTMEPDLTAMLSRAEAALLIGDIAMIEQLKVNSGYYEGIIVTDVGAVWKEMTGESMVYAVWVVKKDFAGEHPQEIARLASALQASLRWGREHEDQLIALAQDRSPWFTEDYLRRYFHTITHSLTEKDIRAMNAFFDYAYKTGILEERVKIEIWREKDGR